MWGLWSICGCMSHINSPLRCLWVYFHALLSGRISVGVYPRIWILWSPWVCVPKDFQCLYLSGCIYQHVRFVTCLSVHIARLKVSGVIWVVFLRPSLWSFVHLCHMRVCHLFGWVCMRSVSFEVICPSLWDPWSVCVCMSENVGFFLPFVCVHIPESERVYLGILECGSLFVGVYPRMSGPSFLWGCMSQRVHSLMSLWVWFSECEDCKH